MRRLLVASVLLAVGAACGGDDDGSQTAEQRVLIACNEGDDAGDSIRAADLFDELSASLPPGVDRVAPDGYCVRITFADGASEEQRTSVEDRLRNRSDIVEMRYDS